MDRELGGGQLLYQLRRPWSDGSTALLWDSREFLERLAALVPAPRRPVLADHGVLGPHAAWRAAIVPQPPVQADAPAPDTKRPRSPGRPSGATLWRRVFAVEGLVGPRWAGSRRIAGAVTDPPAGRRLLAARGLAAEPPPPMIAPRAAIQ